MTGFSYFRLIFVLPAFYLIVAYGVFSFKNRKLRFVVIGGVLLVNLMSTGIYLFNPRFHREDWRSAVSFIENNSVENSVVFFVSQNQSDPYRYYAKSVPYYGMEGSRMLNADKIWLMRYVQPIFDPQDNLRKNIERVGYRKISERDFNGIVVWEYDKKN